MADFNLTSAEERGCGERQEGGLYACSGTSPNGRPLEDFILDPAIPWMDGSFRGAQQIDRGDYVDLVMWVGKEHYPFAPDFAEEGRVHGFSKRIPSPKSADYSRVVPFKSRLLLVHPRGIARSAYSLKPVEEGCKPRVERPCQTHPACLHDLGWSPQAGVTPCTYALWDLSALEDKGDHHSVSAEGARATVTTPSASYEVMQPTSPTGAAEYVPGVFLAIYLTHFEYVSEEGLMPGEIAGVLGNNIGSTAIVPK